MPIYIGVLEEGGVNHLYISSVLVLDQHFETESIRVECTPHGRKNFDSAKTDLRILRNKLTNGDIPNRLIIVEDA